VSINTAKYIENFLKIQDKKTNIIPFKLNKPQWKLYNALKKQREEGKPQRAVVLKARQMGFSTLTEGIIFKKTVTAKNVKSGIITHEASATNNLFEISKRFLNNLPDSMKPTIKNSNAKMLIFNNDKGTGLNSVIKCMTAGGKSAGRSDTFQNLHISELAFWSGNKDETLAGLMQSVPNDLNTVVIIESTANGYEQFKEIWDAAVKGENDFVAVFCAWWELDEYRMPYDGFELDDEEKSLKKRFKLDNEQLAWRRWCINNNCHGSVETFHQEYPSYPAEAFLSSGSCIFDENKILERQSELKEPIKQGSFLYDYDGLRITNIRWQNEKQGIIKIYKDVDSTKAYVIGGDPAGEGSDNNVGQVIEHITGEQVAILAHQTDEDLYARQMYCLGMYYNQALIGIEVNFSTFPQKELQRLKYPHMYVRRTEDTYTSGIQKKYGFQTTSKTRPIIIAGLVEIARESIDSINDNDTLDEMLTFVKNEKGRAEAMQGYHDDRVMALAIAYYIREQQAYGVQKDKTIDKTKWSEDMLEDYYNASDEEKIKIEEMYGSRS